jgi:hypothetical protein
MEILYVPNGGFGDVSWSTSWPRIFSERGHEVDVFLMRHTGNPFHANPFIRKMFVEEKMKAAKEIRAVIESHSYNAVFIPEATTVGVGEVIEVTKDLKNVYLFKSSDQSQAVFDIEIPPKTKPEWYFTEKESEYIEDSNLKNSILFHPVSSSTYEKSRNISFDLIIECSKKLENVVVAHGGISHLPVDDLKRMEAAGIRLLWEDYNCFNDEYGHPLGKLLALVSQCQISIHGWSGSFTMPMGYNKPYIVVVPTNKIRQNRSVPYIDARKRLPCYLKKARAYGCLNPSAWCITEETAIIIEAINHVQAGKTEKFDEKWISFKGDKDVNA